MRRGVGMGCLLSDADRAASQLKRLRNLLLSDQTQTRGSKLCSSSSRALLEPAPPCLPLAGSGAGAPLAGVVTAKPDLGLLNGSAPGSGMTLPLEIAIRAREYATTYMDNWRGFKLGVSGPVLGKVRVCAYIYTFNCKTIPYLHQTLKRTHDPHLHKNKEIKKSRISVLRKLSLIGNRDQALTKYDQTRGGTVGLAMQRWLEQKRRATGQRGKVGGAKDQFQLFSSLIKNWLCCCGSPG